MPNKAPKTTEAQLKALQRGDIIRHVTGNSYMVISNRCGIVIAVREVQVCNASEWVVVKKHDWKGEEGK